MGMVEKVALAIYEAMDITDGLDMSSANTYARGALSAMREPDDAMRSVFIEADWKEWPAESTFVVAIDKALES